MIDDYGEIKNKERGKLLYVPTRLGKECGGEWRWEWSG